MRLKVEDGTDLVDTRAVTGCKISFVATEAASWSGYKAISSKYLITPKTPGATKPRGLRLRSAYNNSVDGLLTDRCGK